MQRPAEVSLIITMAGNQAEANPPHTRRYSHLGHLRGSRSPFNQLKEASKLKPLRGILGKSQAKKRKGEQMIAADNPALRSLSRNQLDILENYQEMFNMADESGNGVLDKASFVEFLQSTGAAVNTEQAAQIFEVSDIDGDGSVSWDEFEQVLHGILSGHLRVHVLDHYALSCGCFRSTLYFSRSGM